MSNIGIAARGRYADLGGDSGTTPERLIALRGIKGRVIFVDSAASGSADGNSWAGAHTTLVLAHTAAKAGDLILVAPGHTETVTAAGTLTVSKSSLTFVGLGVGRNRPTINYTTAIGASVDISGSNVQFRNFVFTPTGFDAITAAVNVTGDDVEFIGCDFQLATSAAQAVLGILTTAAADRMTVSGCRFYGSADAGTVAAIRIVGGDGHIIEDCIAQGNYTTTLGMIDNVTTATTNCIVRRNAINNRTASSAVCMTFVATTSTGQIYENRMQVLTGTAPIVGSGMSWVGANYYAATIANAGTLI